MDNLSKMSNYARVTKKVDANKRGKTWKKNGRCGKNKSKVEKIRKRIQTKKQEDRGQKGFYPQCPQPLKLSLLFFKKQKDKNNRSRKVKSEFARKLL